MGAILVLGATSDIAKATIHKLAAKGRDLVLAGRRMDEMEKMKRDLEIRYQVTIWIEPFDALDFDWHETFFTRCVEKAGKLDGLLLMYGTMADQKEAEQDFSVAKQMIDVNYSSAVSILNLAADYFEKRKAGFICGVSSVAGDKGRKSNYIYGSTKSALTTYLEGLRNRLHASNVHVMTIKPGIIDTKMTYGVVEPTPLMAPPETAANDIVKGLDRKKETVYTPWFWLFIMLIIKHLPEKWFKRTDL
ncbi:MAG: SDR family oxidoreductase [Bacillaceae bacterium]|nr:SDR family oxidoreductase [Bacillaceae bacterium]